jgi:environmental stress-induced protein Ves
MKLKIHHLNPSKTITWASGTSTELFVFPENGNFQTREFDFRISTATVEAQETNFSDFTGLTRILMVLKGHLTLIHEGKYTTELATFDQDRFDGSWNTRSKGKVQDFNVMFNENYEAEVTHLPFAHNDSSNLTLHDKYYFFFIVDGKFEFNGEFASPGDLIEIENPISQKIVVQCLEKGNILECKIEKIN